MEIEFSMNDVIERLWRYERHMISDGYERALEELPGLFSRKREIAPVRRKKCNER